MRTGGFNLVSICCFQSPLTVHSNIFFVNEVYFLGFLDGREAIARMNREEQTSDQTLLRDRLVSEVSNFIF